MESQDMSITDSIPDQEYPSTTPPKLIGPLSAIYYEIMQLYFSTPLPFNYTVVRQTDRGSFQDVNGTKLFTGCYGSITRNQSDLTLMSVDYPVHDYEEIVPIQLAIESSLAMLQGYNKSHNHIRADIFYSGIKSLNNEVWILTFIAILFFALLFRLKETILFRKEQSNKCLIRKQTKSKGLLHFFAVSLTHFIQQEETEFKDSLRRFCSILLSIFSFIVIQQYFCNQMTADMVVVEKPTTIDSYKDILQKESLIPLFFKQLDNFKYFKDGLPGSIEKVMWRHVVDKRLKGNEEGIFVPKDLSSKFFPLLMTAATGTRLLIIDDYLTPPIRFFICKFKINSNLYPELMTWAPRDPYGTRIQKGLVMNPNVKKTKVLKRLLRRFTGAVEGDLFQDVLRTMRTFKLPDMYNLNEKTDDNALRECKSDTLVMDLPELEPDDMTNFKLLMTLSMTLFSISLLNLMTEIVILKLRLFMQKISSRLHLCT